MSNRPPEQVTIKVCPLCGRNDRFIPFTGRRHSTRGEVCPGTPESVEYALLSRLEQAERERDKALSAAERAVESGAAAAIGWQFTKDRAGQAEQREAKLREAVSAVVTDPEVTGRGPLTITRGQLDLLRAAFAGEATTAGRAGADVHLSFGDAATEEQTP